MALNVMQRSASDQGRLLHTLYPIDTSMKSPLDSKDWISHAFRMPLRVTVNANGDDYQTDTIIVLVGVA